MKIESYKKLIIALFIISTILLTTGIICAFVCLIGQPMIFFENLPTGSYADVLKIATFSATWGFRILALAIILQVLENQKTNNKEK